MNTPTRLLTGLALAVGLIAPLPAQEEPMPPVAEENDNYPASSPAELDELLGPIALYPDDLVSLILPAATETTDIVLAARYLDAGGSIDRVDQQPWDESVRAVAHFPEVVSMLNEDLAWTQQVGDEFLLQPAEVMKSIQRLRAKAYAAGTLRDTAQQKVLVDGDVIRIVPAVENVVYVPRYRTEVVYVDSPVYYSEPCITFGIGWYIGNWHRWDCDWYNHRVWVYSSHSAWRNHHYYYRHPHHDYRGHDRDRHDGRAWNPPPYRTRPGYHHRGDGHRDGRHYAGPDRGRDDRHDRDRDNRNGRNDHRNPGARRSQPSSPTEVVARDVIANQRNRDRHDDNRASRPHNVTTPSTPTTRRSSPTTTVTSTVETNTRRTTSSRGETTRTQTYRSRPETTHERSVNRSVQAYTPERRTPTSTVTARVRQSTSTQASVSRNSTPTSRVTASRSEYTRGSSSPNSHASSSRSTGGSGRSSSSSDSGRSRGSSRSDDGNRSNSDSRHSGRNR